MKKHFKFSVSNETQTFHQIPSCKSTPNVSLVLPHYLSLLIWESLQIFACSLPKLPLQVELERDGWIFNKWHGRLVSEQ